MCYDKIGFTLCKLCLSLWLYSIYVSGMVTVALSDPVGCLIYCFNKISAGRICIIIATEAVKIDNMKEL